MTEPRMKPGDLVRCDVSYYTWYSKDEVAIIAEVGYSSKGNPLIYLSNPHSETGYTGYNACNWTVVKPKKEKPMANAYERKTYMGIEVDNHGHPTGVSTAHFNMKSDCIAAVQDILEHGEDTKWLVIETVCLIQRAEPRPPIVITEYK